MSIYNILVAPGDAHGPQVVEQAVKVLRLVEKSAHVRFELRQVQVGKALEQEIGRRITDDILNEAKRSDAVLFGYEAPPVIKPNGEVDCALLAFRAGLGLYANCRLSKSYNKSLHHLSPLRSEVVAGTEILTVREVLGGAYGSGNKVERDDFAEDKWSYTKDEVQRIARVAGSIAMANDPPLQVTSVDKAIMLANSRLWRNVVSKTFADEFPQVPLRHQLVDNAAMLLMQSPKAFNGIILTENTFGDILSDELCVIPGSLGLIPSATLAGSPGSERPMGFYEPMHGPGVEDLEEKFANPIGSILSVAMMLKYTFSMLNEASAVEKAVAKVLDPVEAGGLGLRTKDLGGTATCADAGDAVCSLLGDILRLR